VPQQGEGVWADFFGQPAYTMSLPAKLQRMTGATVILAYAERLPRGVGYVLRFMPFEQTLGNAPERQINASMEQLIARSPAQYFWSYNRYKTPAGIPRPATENEIS
jgi:Kdo2-lipid IVA lauroyltransferase/acyltransferase